MVREQGQAGVLPQLTPFVVLLEQGRHRRADLARVSGAGRRPWPGPTNAPRFGIWAAVHGSRASHHDPDEPDDASWERNCVRVLEGEVLGFDSVLIA